MQVSSGMACGFSQDVVAVNSAEKQCCIVGEPNKRAIITPDLDSILESVEDLWLLFLLHKHNFGLLMI